METASPTKTNEDESPNERSVLLHPTVSPSSKPGELGQAWLCLPAFSWLAWLGLFLGILTMNLDVWLELTAYPKIGSGFGEQQHAAWFAQVYQFVVVISQPIYASISDKIGRKKPLIIGYIFFVAGNVVGSATTSFKGFLAARMVVGLGAATMWFMVSIILNDVVKKSKRSAWEGVAKTVATLGQVSGVVVGAYLTEIVEWHKTFLIPAALTAVCLLFVGWKLPILIIGSPASKSALLDDSSIPSDRSSELRSIGAKRRSMATVVAWNLSGGLLFTTSVGCLCLALSFKGDQFAIAAPRVLLLLIASIFLGAGFVWHHLRTPASRLINFRLVCHPSRRWLYLATAFREATIIGVWINILAVSDIPLTIAKVIFLIPRYSAAKVEGLWPRTAIMMSCPVGFAIGAFIVHECIDRSKKLYASFIASQGLVMLTVFLMWLRLSGAGSPWEVATFAVVFGTGAGAANGAFLVGLLQMTSKPDRAMMYGACKFVTTLAVLLSIALLNSFIPGCFSSHMLSNLENSLPSERIQGLISSCIKDQKCVDDQDSAIRDVIELSLRQAYADVIGLPIAFAVASMLFGALNEEISVEDGEDVQPLPVEGISVATDGDT